MTRRSFRYPADDYTPAPPSLEEQLAGTFFDHPARPTVRGAEQRVFALDGTTQERYEAWRVTADGQAMLGRMRAIALQMLAQRPGRKLGSRRIWELAGWELFGGAPDNRLQPLACREVEDTTPALRGTFRHREQLAAQVE